MTDQDFLKSVKCANCYHCSRPPFYSETKIFKNLDIFYCNHYNTIVKHYDWCLKSFIDKNDDLRQIFYYDNKNNLLKKPMLKN